MIRLKTMVVATDLSPLSQCAVRHACGLAVQFGAHLHVLHVASYPFSEFAQECQKDYGRSIGDCEREYFEAAEQGLSEVDTGSLKEPSLTRVAVQGFPIAEILRYTQQHEADVLLLGTHGFTGLKHVLLGSVAEAMVRTSPCPVLTVRDPAHQFVQLTEATTANSRV